MDLFDLYWPKSLDLNCAGLIWSVSFSIKVVEARMLCEARVLLTTEIE